MDGSTFGGFKRGVDIADDPERAFDDDTQRVLPFPELQPSHSLAALARTVAPLHLSKGLAEALAEAITWSRTGKRENTEADHLIFGLTLPCGARALQDKGVADVAGLQSALGVLMVNRDGVRTEDDPTPHKHVVSVLYRAAALARLEERDVVTVDHAVDALIDALSRDELHSVGAQLLKERCGALTKSEQLQATLSDLRANQDKIAQALAAFVQTRVDGLRVELDDAHQAHKAWLTSHIDERVTKLEQALAALTERLPPLPAATRSKGFNWGSAKAS